MSTIMPSDTPTDELLLILSEECSELIQASTKIIRQEHNDTHVGSSEQLWGNLVEEMGDVLVMINAMLIKYPELQPRVEASRDQKRSRWIYRLNS